LPALVRQNAVRASETDIEQESRSRTKVLTWIVIVLIVGLVGAITVATVNGSAVIGSQLTSEQRAEIEQAKSCDELGSLHARYSPTATMPPPKRRS
jgi:hypothetical protein